jgi:hypothetical protein
MLASLYLVLIFAGRMLLFGHLSIKNKMGVLVPMIGEGQLGCELAFPSVL